MAAERHQLFLRIPRPMPSESVQPVTELLRVAQAGDAAAAERLMAVVYEQLHQLARARMAELPPGQTLQPTALVHEAYLRLTDKSDVAWESRRHFFAAARAMRDILVEQARRKAGPERVGRVAGRATSLRIQERALMGISSRRAIACGTMGGQRPRARRPSARALSGR